MVESTQRRNPDRPPNILLIGIDSLRADHMSLYGYRHGTTPHIEHLARQGTTFENCFCPHIPTTSGYASMFTGRDVFGTQVVALRHKGPMRPEAATLADILGRRGYNTTCVGFAGNAASRGFDTYLSYPGWGSWAEGRSPKAQNLNDVTLPEMDRLIDDEAPFFLFLRHMDPHAPYLPPAPFERAFYHGDECDPSNRSMDPVFAFKPFRDFFKTWMPPGVTDKDYVIAQYDGAIAYMDAAIQAIFTALEARGVMEDTIVVVNSDHGETLYDHDCFFDHHGLYDNTLHVPLVIRYPRAVPAGLRVPGYVQHKDLLPTLLQLADIATDGEELAMEGHSLVPLMRGEISSYEGEFYITECTWMRKHGWRTPEWKLIVALEPDFHFKPPVELYNLVTDPDENHNLAHEEPAMVAILRARMEAWIAKREAETGLPNPIYCQGDWHGHEGMGAFTSSEQAYETLHIGDVRTARRLQAKEPENDIEPADDTGETQGED